ncbi:hypothetical protein ABTX15_22340 [Micromonospora sp. NPDC094482]|uniref:hypothetical protein n=1 Tax=unclassified Micromonospora TaxID=2617518 RepID=UPI003323EE86
MTDTRPHFSTRATLARGVLAGLVANIVGVVYLCGAAAGRFESNAGLTVAIALFLLVSVPNHILNCFKDRLPAPVSRINDLVGTALIVIGVAALLGTSFAVFVLGIQIFD